VAERREPIQDIAHLGQVELLTPKPNESLWYFRDLLGMEVAHTENQSVYLRGYGDYAASTLTLTEAKQAGVACIAFRTVSPAALERRARSIEGTGLGVGWVDGGYGRGKTYRFHDPDGHLMEIYYEAEKYTPPETLRSALKNQPMKYLGRGVGVKRIDHVAMLCKDVAANRTFFQEHMGYRLREQVVFGNGTQEIGSWMSATPVHHEIAYVVDVKGLSGRIHHFSLWVDNREDILRAADILSENEIFIEAGPSKHNNSQAFYLYSYEPGGNRIEVYSGSFLILAPDWEPVIWNEEERGTGVYWGGALPDSFLNYATPTAEVSDNSTAEKKEIAAFDPL